MHGPQHACMHATPWCCVYGLQYLLLVEDKSSSCCCCLQRRTSWGVDPGWPPVKLNTSRAGALAAFGSSCCCCSTHAAELVKKCMLGAARHGSGTISAAAAAHAGATAAAGDSSHANYMCIVDAYDTCRGFDGHSRHRGQREPRRSFVKEV